jgi:hypothetical protein
MQQMTSTQGIWTFRDRHELGSNVTETHADLTGFHVEALDGSLGKVDHATYEVGRSHIVVDTGPWILGTKVVLPAGIVTGIDETTEQVFVNRTKDEVEHAPELDETLVADEAYRSNVGSYYGPGGSAYRDWDETGS